MDQNYVKQHEKRTIYGACDVWPETLVNFTENNTNDDQNANSYSNYDGLNKITITTTNIALNHVR